MIELLHKKDCCGCSACVQICPKHCISMKEDEEGFLYPVTDTDLCVDCHLCEKVCPVINQNDPKEPLNVYAAKNPDEMVRKQSSSGGIFTMLAESVIDKGGVVFGASFNEHWAVVHSYSETKEGLAAFRMSKYVQSVIGNTYKEAETFLKSGRKVLFSGTPCQIAGLKKYLRKEYENLLTVDFICHGVPSPGVFRWYMAEEFQKLARKSKKKFSFAFQSIPLIPEVDILASEAGYHIEDIRFRDKKLGWKKFSFAFDLSEPTCDGEKNTVSLSYPLDKNPFLKGFLSDLYLRPSCYHCVFRNLSSQSEITIGDFWGINSISKVKDDDKGISALLINSTKNNIFLSQHFIDILAEASYDELCRNNAALCKSSVFETRKKIFFSSRDSLFSRIKRLSDSRFRVSNIQILKTYIKRFIK